ncbi:hypothetical protein E4M02_09915 [Brevundimonas sp. S30B]|uniref:hypothetical protein n=1 Tax=unclassified Brevundimonas TaxID=2622653 RepID=UPI001071AB33|nr:hypothetical protein E4M01_11140 [Brevundimonas sp. MF30-B]TFW01602.1 hypothetical protein E4M02_09915 [Brevundimonas sp. S30B]
MRLTDDQLAARKRRNLAIAGALVAFIVLVFIVTVLNLRRNIEAGKVEREAGLATAVVPPGPAPASAPAALVVQPSPEARP